MPRSPRDESLLGIAQDCFCTEWFRELKQIRDSAEAEAKGSEDMAWGASIYVSRRAVQALGRSLTTMERVQVLELCRRALTQEIGS